jgi:hypothetical protein
MSDARPDEANGPHPADAPERTLLAERMRQCPEGDGYFRVSEWEIREVAALEQETIPFLKNQLVAISEQKMGLLKEKIAAEAEVERLRAAMQELLAAYDRLGMVVEIADEVERLRALTKEGE